MAKRQNRDTTTDLHAALHRSMRWKVPEHFNMAQVCSRRWAEDSQRAEWTAVIATAPNQPDTAHSYARLQTQANRLSNTLAALGVQRGDRVAIAMPQCFETAVAHIATLQMGAVCVPLSQQFGPEAMGFRLHDSEAVVALCDASTVATVQSVSGECPALQHLVVVGGAQGALDWTAVLAQELEHFRPVDTHADEAALLIYTSGTTGNPKGTLIPHRALIGNLPGFVCSQNWFGFDPWDASSQSQAVFWSPADWAWTGGLMDALLLTLYFGRPIVAHNGRFSPQTAFELMQRHGVTHTFLFPTALKAMMKACPKPQEHFALGLQAIMSAGEAVGDAVAIRTTGTGPLSLASYFIGTQEFLVEIAWRSGCGILLDVNNVMVSAVNHRLDPFAYVDRFPVARVGEAASRPSLHRRTIGHRSALGNAFSSTFEVQKC